MSRLSHAPLVLILAALLWVGSAAVAQAQEQLFAISGGGKGTPNMGPFPVSTLYELHPSTGAWMATIPLAGGHRHVVSIDFDPTTGVLWGIANGAGPVEGGVPPPPFPAGFPFALNGPTGLLITINPSTGVTSPGIPIRGMDPHFSTDFAFQCQTNTSDMSFDSSGTLFVFRPCTSQVYTVDLGGATPGAATLIGPRLPPIGPVGFTAIHPVSGQAGLAFDLAIGGDPLFMKDFKELFGFVPAPPPPSSPPSPPSLS